MQEKLASDGGRTTLLSNPSIRALLTNPLVRTDSENEMVIMSEHLERRGEEIRCWMCGDCRCALERSTLPKFTLANNLCLGDMPFELTGLMILEQLLIACHYLWCYIFKLFPQEYNG